jgi:hypothetical protein
MVERLAMVRHAVERIFQTMSPSDDTPSAGETITREEAKALEEDFHGRLRAKLGVLREIFNPMDRRVYFVDPSIRLREWDQGSEVKRIMLEAGVLDRAVRRHMPSNRTVRLDIGTRGLFSGFTPTVAVAGIAVSPLEDLATQGWTDAPVEFTPLQDAVKRAADRPKVFHFVGVYATTGFAEACLEQPPRSRNLTTFLVAKGPDTAWRVLNAEGHPWREAPALFDLETPAEKLDRCRRGIEEHPDLRLKGGHVQLDLLRRELGFPDEVFERALGRVLQESEGLQVKELDGIMIVQRPRF